jgi:hypothetical protein
LPSNLPPGAVAVFSGIDISPAATSSGSWLQLFNSTVARGPASIPSSPSQEDQIDRESEY